VEFRPPPFEQRERLAAAGGFVGEVVGRLERKGLRLVAASLRMVDRGLAEAHYEEHKGKPFYPGLLDFIMSGPVFAMVVEGPDDDTWQLCRILMGATRVEDALPGTIRGDLATTTGENLVHGSDGLWFPDVA